MASRRYGFPVQYYRFVWLARTTNMLGSYVRKRTTQVFQWRQVSFAGISCYRRCKISSWWANGMEGFERFCWTNWSLDALGPTLGFLRRERERENSKIWQVSWQTAVRDKQSTRSSENSRLNSHQPASKVAKLPAYSLVHLCSWDASWLIWTGT